MTAWRVLSTYGNFSLEVSLWAVCTYDCSANSVSRFRRGSGCCDTEEGSEGAWPDGHTCSLLDVLCGQYGHRKLRFMRERRVDSLLWSRDTQHQCLLAVRSTEHRDIHIQSRDRLSSLWGQRSQTHCYRDAVKWPVPAPNSLLRNGSFIWFLLLTDHCDYY